MITLNSILHWIFYSAKERKMERMKRNKAYWDERIRQVKETRDRRLAAKNKKNNNH